MLGILCRNQALLKAKSHLKKKEFLKAQKLYQAVLSAFPENIKARQELDLLKKNKKINLIKSSPQLEIKQLLNLFNKRQFSSVVQRAQVLLAQYSDSFILWNILGASYFKLKLLDNAVKAYKKAILLKPDYAKAYSNLGTALKKQGKLFEAIEAYKKSILIQPDFAESYYSMGVALQKLGMYDMAIKAYGKALLFKPNHAEIYNNIGIALQYDGKIEEAIVAYEKALQLNPNYENTRAQKLFQQANISNWNITEEDSKLISSLGTFHEPIPPFTALCLEDSPKRHRLRSEIFIKEKYTQNPFPYPAIPSNKPERIHIGYFSADYHNHATMHLMAKVFKIHDRKKFKIYAYSYGPDKKDQTRQTLVNSFDVFNDVSEMSDRDIAIKARQDKIDIAVDLKGLTKDQRLGIFAYRAAPLQISFLGYPGTTGASFIDYIIADPIIIPSNQVNAYSEKIIYLPNTYQPNDNTRPISKKVGSKKDMGLPEKDFVFCCFNNNYKISSEEFDIWMRLLGNIKESVLWLLKPNQLAEQNLKKEAEKRGIQSDRLIFAKKLPYDEHLARHKHADLFIDTFNVNAHTTASDALWAGLPLVTNLGQSFAARVAGSLLNAVGLNELITKSKKNYEELILELATSPDKLKKIKIKLEANRLTKALFDTEKFTNDLENGYQKAYQNYFDGNNPQNIRVIDSEF